VFVCWKKIEKKRGGDFDSIFYGLTLEGKYMSLLKFFCCLDAYLKLYLRLNFLGFHNLFLHKLYVLLRFSCLICMNVVAHHIFFDLYGLFFYLDDLYGVFSGFISSRFKI
jgi:hypothetical protein